MSGIEAVALSCPTLHLVITIFEGVDRWRFNDVGWQLIPGTHHEESKNVLCELCREFAEKELELRAHPSN